MSYALSNVKSTVGWFSLYHSSHMFLQVSRKSFKKGQKKRKEPIDLCSRTKSIRPSSSTNSVLPETRFFKSGSNYSFLSQFIRIKHLITFSIIRRQISFHYSWGVICILYLVHLEINLLRSQSYLTLWWNKLFRITIAKLAVLHLIMVHILFQKDI